MTDEGAFRIAAAARAAGLSADVLRAWFRRYDVVPTTRTAAGARVVGPKAVERLRLLRALVERGHSIGQLVARTDAELARALGTHQGTPHDAHLEAIVIAVIDALVGFELSDAEETLARAGALLDPREFVLSVVAPLLHELGERWAKGQIHVAQEHAASVVVRNVLSPFLRQRAHATGPIAVFATLGGERHEFGAIGATVLAGEHGFRARFLGSDLSAPEIVLMAQRLRASVVGVSMPTAASVAELAALRAALPAEVGVVAGGAHARSMRGVVHLTRLADLEAALDAHAQRTQRAPPRSKSPPSSRRS